MLVVFARAAPFVELYSTDKDLVAGLAAAEKSVQAFGKKVAEVGTRLQGFGKALIGIGVGAAAGVVLATRSFARFEDALASIRANSDKAVGADAFEKLNETMEKVKKTVLEVSKRTGQGATLVATVFNEMLKAGLEVDDVLDGVGESVVRFAKVAQVEPEKAAGIIATSMKVFGVTSSKAMDVMASAADSSAVSLDQVVDSFQQFAVVGHAAGLSIDEVATAVALLGNVGIAGSDAGTSLKTMLQRLMSPTEEVTKVMHQFGIDVRNSRREMLPLRGIIGELQKKLAGLNSEQRAQAIYGLFGSDAQRAGLVLLHEGVKGLDDFSNSMSKANTVAEKYAILMSTLNGSITRLLSAWERLSIAIGEVFGPSLGRVIGMLAGFMDWISLVITANKNLTVGLTGVITAFLLVSGALAVVGAGLAVLGYAWATLVGLLTTGMSLFLGFGGVLLWVGRTLYSLQGGLLGLGKIFRNFVVGPLKLIGQAFKQLFGDLLKHGWQGFDVLALWIGDLGSNLGLLLTKSNLVQIGLRALANVLVQLVGGFKSVANGVMAFASSILKILGGMFSAIWESAKQAMTGIGDAVTAGDLGLAFQIVVQEAKIIFGEGMLALLKMWQEWGVSLVNVITSIGAWIQAVWVETWFGVQEIFIKVMYGMGNAFLAFTDVIVAGWNHIVEFVTNIVKIMTDAFLSAIEWMGKAWTTFKETAWAAIYGIDDAFFKVVRGISAGLFAIQNLAISSFYAMSDAFFSVIDWMGRAWEGFTKLMSRLWNAVWSGEIVTVPLAAINQMFTDYQNALTDMFAKVPAQKDVLAGMEEARKKELEGLQANQAAGAEARKQAAAEAIAARQEELRKAKEGLTELTDKAKALKEKLGEGGEGVGKAGAKKPPIDEGIGAGLAAATKKVESRGTFSAIAAARGFGAGESVYGKLEEAHKEQKKQTRELEKINKKGKMTFT